MGESEDPAAAAMREAEEETGLDCLRLAAHLGDFEQSAPDRDEVWLRYCYHVVCWAEPPARWRHHESDPADGSPGPILLEFFWAKLPDGVPPLAAGHEVMLPRLLAAVLSEE